MVIFLEGPLMVDFLGKIIRCHYSLWDYNLTQYHETHSGIDNLEKWFSGLFPGCLYFIIYISTLVKNDEVQP